MFSRSSRAILKSRSPRRHNTNQAGDELRVVADIDLEIEPLSAIHGATVAPSLSTSTREIAHRKSLLP